MKSTLLTTVTLLVMLFLTTIDTRGQQTMSHDSWDYCYTKGVQLAEEGYFGVSCKYLERFVAENNDAVLESIKTIGAQKVRISPASVNSKVEDACYWLCYCHFMMKSKETLSRIEAHLCRYPESEKKGELKYMEGRWYYEKKEWAKVVQSLSQVDSRCLNYENEELCDFALAYSYLQLKEYDKASAGFQKSMNHSRHYYNESGYYYAYSEFCLKNYDVAIEAFHQIDDNAKFKESAEFHILQIYDARGQRQASVEKGMELLEKYPKSRHRNEAYRIIGENAYRNQSYHEAASALSNYVREQKKPHREAIYMQGLAYYKIKEYKNAITALGRLTAVNDSFACNAYLYIGYCYLELNMPQNAGIAFQKAVQSAQDPATKEEAAYNYTLATYERKAPFGETVKAFEGFVNEYPKSKYKESILEHMAEAYMAENDYRAAIAAIDKMDVKSDKLNQVKETALFKLGVDALEQRIYNEAYDWFSQSIAMNTDKSKSSQAYLWRAECSYRTNNVEATRNDIKKYLSTPQKKSTDCLLKAYYTLAYTYWEQKEYRMARPYFAKFQEISGSEKSELNSDVICRMGDCYYNNRDFENALNTYWSVPVKDKYADYAQYQIAQIYGLQHNYTEKIEALQRLLSRHPQSDWNDEAMYEIGRTYVLQEKNEEAIQAYLSLQKQHPMSKWTRKATLEIAMLNANLNKIDEAFDAYKFVVDKYPSSEEARVALDGMQSLSVEANRVDDYLQFRQSVAGITVQTVNSNEEDSLQFLAAEKIYMKNDWNVAVGALNNYITRYCDELSFNCITAQFYLAESYYNIGNKQQAMLRYHKLTTMDGNEYMEPALLRAAEIAYDKGEYASANTYFNKLLLVATTGENRTTARLGILRCSYYTNLYEQTITAANNILELKGNSAELVREARYNRAKSYIALHRTDSAVIDLIELSKETNTKVGAESSYLYAQYLFDNGQIKQSEAVIMQLIEAGTSHQYWMARSFLLLSDIYKAQDDKVMARMYLESLQENYSADDDIHEMINTRMRELEEVSNNDEITE